MSKGKASELLGKLGITAEQLLYFLAFGFLVGGEVLHTTMFEAPVVLYSFCRLVAQVLILVKLIVYQRKELPYFCLALLLLVFANMLYMTYDYSMPLDMTLLVVGARNVPFKKIAAVYFYVASIIVAAAIIASLFGVIKNLQYTDYRGVRNSFGIIYPTDFAAHILYIMLAFVCAYEEKLKIYHYAVGVIIALVVYYFCKARVDVACMLLFLIGTAVIRLAIKKEKSIVKNQSAYSTLKKICGGICIASMPLAALGMIILTLIYNPSSAFFVKLDKILSGRLALGAKGFADYDFTLLGQPVALHGLGGSTEPPEEYFFLDCSYIYCLLIFGAVFTLMLVAAFVLCGIKYKHSGIFLYIIAIISLNSMIAHHLPDIAYNPFAIALFAQGGLTMSELFPRLADKLKSKPAKTPAAVK